MAINCNTNTAAPATATATTTTTHKKVTIDRPPPMLPHTTNEFKFAERVLQKMVLDSEFFPKRAASNDWFKSIDHRPNRGKSGSGSSSGVYYNYNAAIPQTRTPAVVEPIKRRSSRSAAVEDTSSVATASTSNSVSSSEQGNGSNSPFPRRRSLADLSLLDQERLGDMPFAIRVSDNSGSNNSNHNGLSNSNKRTNNNSLSVSFTLGEQLRGSFTRRASVDKALAELRGSFNRRASVDNAQLNSYVPAAPLPLVDKKSKMEDTPREGVNRKAAIVAPLPLVHKMKNEMKVKEMKPGGAVNGGAASDAEKKEYAPILSVHEKNIHYGKLLGTGGFCEVRLASLKTKDCRTKADRNNQRQYAMKYLSPTKLVPKPTTKPDTKNDANGNNKDPKPPRNKVFERGIADLAIEAHFLTLLSHPHIIDLHHVSEGRLDEQFNCERNNYYHQFGYFLLLDPLFETLSSRINDTYVPRMFRSNNCDWNGEGTSSSNNDAVSAGSSATRRSSWWKRMIPKNHYSSSSANGLPLDTWRLQLVERLEALKGVAQALSYLHDEKIIYRDLKPDNIGFYRKPHPTCCCGKRSSKHNNQHASMAVNQEDGCTCYTEIAKVFDFGLAKELKPKYLQAHPRHEEDGDTPIDTYKLTSKSGSRRYMAPEVAFSSPYNEKADVYSFGIVLYQVASLVTPFEGYSLYKHEEEVLCNGARPNIKGTSSKRSLAKIKKTSSLTHACWQEKGDAEERNKLLAFRAKSVWTDDLKYLVRDCWHEDMRARPRMKVVATMLDGIIGELKDTVAAKHSSVADQESSRKSSAKSINFYKPITTSECESIRQQ